MCISFFLFSFNFALCIRLSLSLSLTCALSTDRKVGSFIHLSFFHFSLSSTAIHASLSFSLNTSLSPALAHLCTFDRQLTVKSERRLCEIRSERESINMQSSDKQKEKESEYPAASTAVSCLIRGPIQALFGGCSSLDRASDEAADSIIR